MEPRGWGLVAIAAVVLLVTRALRINFVVVILLIIGATLVWDWIPEALGG